VGVSHLQRAPFGVPDTVGDVTSHDHDDTTDTPAPGAHDPATAGEPGHAIPTEDAASVDDTPVDGSPVDDTPVDDTPVDGTPVDEASTSGATAPTGWRSRLNRPAKRWETVVYSVLAVCLAVAAVWGVQPSGHAALRPGSGIDVSSLVEGRITDPAFPRDEHVMGLTVTVDPLSRAAWVLARLRGEELLETVEQHGAVQQLDVSRSAAVAAAWELATGEELTTTAVVTTVLAGSPAEQAGLEAGDRILLADDRDVRTATMLSALIRNAGAGAKVRLLVERGERRTTVTVTVGEDARIGVAVADTLVTQPLDVHVAGVGGGSAGLAFALAFVDAIGEGDLLAGRVVAATGTIGRDGTVGEIGGLAVKLRSATARAAEVVFVPLAQLDETGGNPRVRGVRTLAEAVAVLCETGATDAVCDRLPAAQD
jgi:PDZ domain-containing secreted protein